MEKEFIPYEQALGLKELGFDEHCFAYYDENEDFTSLEFDVYSGGDLSDLFKNHNNDVEVNAPLYQQAFRWFREKYPKLDFAVGKIYNGTNNYHYHINLSWEYYEGTYEEAELECLKKLIEIVK